MAIMPNHALTTQPTLSGTPPALDAGTDRHSQPILIDGRWWYLDGNTWHELLPGRRTLTANTVLTVPEAVSVDTRGGSFSVTLPIDARDGDRVFIAEPFGLNSLEANSLTLLSGVVGRLISGNADTWDVDVNQAVLELAYHAADNDWRPIHAVTAASPSAVSTGGGAVAAAPATQGTYAYLVNAGGTGTWTPLTGISGGTF